jgi:hypothetical protein
LVHGDIDKHQATLLEGGEAVLETEAVEGGQMREERGEEWSRGGVFIYQTESQPVCLSCVLDVDTGME